MTFRALKEKNRELVLNVVRWMSATAKALAQVEILQGTVALQRREIQRVTEQSRQRGDECQRLRGNEELLRLQIGAAAHERRAKEDLWESFSPVKDFLKLLPENKWLSIEELPKVTLRALKRMHSTIELHKLTDTTHEQLAAAKVKIRELRSALNRASNVQQSTIETLNDALVGHEEFDGDAAVEDRAADCIKRLGNRVFELVGEVALLKHGQPFIKAGSLGRLAGCPPNGTVVSPCHSGFPQNGTCVLKASPNGRTGAANDLELTFRDGVVIQLVINRLPR